MTTLRIVHRAGSGRDSHRVSVSLEGEGLAPQEFGTEFVFTFPDDEQEELRWYLEEYLQCPLDPAPKQAPAPLRYPRDGAARRADRGGYAGVGMGVWVTKSAKVHERRESLSRTSCRDWQIGHGHQFPNYQSTNFPISQSTSLPTYQ